MGVDEFYSTFAVVRLPSWSITRSTLRFIRKWWTSRLTDVDFDEIIDKDSHREIDIYGAKVLRVNDLKNLFGWKRQETLPRPSIIQFSYPLEIWPEEGRWPNISFVPLLESFIFRRSNLDATSLL